MLATRLKSATTNEITYVGGSIAGFGGRTGTLSLSLTALTGGSNTSPQAGDFVVVYYGVGSTVPRAITVDSSYTNLTKLAASDTFDANLAVGYKRMGATPDTSVTVSATGSIDDAGAVVIHVFRGVDETTPLDVTPVAATVADTVIVNPNGILPVTTGAWILAGGAGAHNAGFRAYSSATLTNFLRDAGTDTNDVSVGVGLFTEWTSGQYDPAAFTWSGTNSTAFSNCSYTIALRPA